MNVVLESYTQNGVKLIADCARITHEQTQEKPDEYYLYKLFKLGHLSVFEHVSFSFKIEGISRACAQQLTRHRLASYTMRSQRYVNEGGFEYYTPPSVKNNQNALDDYNAFMMRARSAYRELIGAGATKEDARFVLPGACLTDLYMTVNFRELIHISRLRMCDEAQAEIRELVYAMSYELPEPYDIFMFPHCIERDCYKCKLSTVTALGLSNIDKLLDELDT